MKATKFNFLTLSLLIFTGSFIISCSNEDVSVEEKQNDVITLSEPQELNQIEVLDDPDFITLSDLSKNDKSTLLRSKSIKIGRIRTYLSKNNGAYGKVFYRVYREYGNELIAQSGTVNVSNLATYSSGSPKYTSVYWDFNKNLNIQDKYRLEVHCKDCPNAQEDDLNVYWWRSEDENYLGYAAQAQENINGTWVAKNEYDFSFNIQNKREDGSLYNSQYNFSKQLPVSINNNTKYGQGFIPKDEFPCEAFDTFSTASDIVNNPNDGSADKLLHLRFTNITTEDTYIGDIILQFFLSNDSNPYQPAGGGFLYVYLRDNYVTIEDSDGIIPAQSTRQIDYELNSQGYKYLIYELKMTDCEIKRYTIQMR